MNNVSILINEKCKTFITFKSSITTNEKSINNVSMVITRTENLLLALKRHKKCKQFSLKNHIKYALITCSYIFKRFILKYINNFLIKLLIVNCS